MYNSVVIIGSGLGGLSCGVVLAKNGYNVTVLEQSAQIGGCLQCFYRKGTKFETGMHFIGSASEGQTLDRLFRFLEIKGDVALSQLDPTGYDVICLKGQKYKYATGKEHFIEQMSQYFPKQRKNLIKYYNLIEEVSSASTLHSLKHAETDAYVNTKYQLASINEVIDSIITDPLLAQVLVGNLPLYAAQKDKTPFSAHAFIMDFYNQSAYRIVGGSDSIATSLHNTILKYGGSVLTNKKVSKILCNDSQAIGVEVNGCDFISADYIISDAHPIRTLELLDTKLIRAAFRERVYAIPQSIGGFSVYLRFKDNSVPYMNSNYYAYTCDSPWDAESYTEKTWPKGFLYMHFCDDENSRFAKSGVMLSYMKIADVEKWRGTNIGHRGTDYEQFKREKAEKMIDLLCQHFPEIKDKISDYYTSTPLTYLDYTGTENGSMYGCVKDVNKSMEYRVPHKTKIPNLFLTGQNINSHGILGVIVGTIVTCSEFLTAQKLYKQILDS